MTLKGEMRDEYIRRKCLGFNDHLYGKFVTPNDADKWILFVGKRPSLLLEEVVLKEGVPIRGWVVNGAWLWQWDGSEITASTRAGTIQTRTPCTFIWVLKFAQTRESWHQWASARAHEAVLMEYPP